MNMCPDDCGYNWQDEDKDYPACHYEGPNCFAPCNLESGEEVK